MGFHSEFVKNNIAQVLTETGNRNLHITCGPVTRSYHQSVLCNYSDLLRAVQAERACCRCQSGSCGRVEDVSVVLDGVDMDTLERLMEYIYTGQCMVRDKRQVLGMIQLKNMLMLDVSLELHRENIKTEQVVGEKPVKADKSQAKKPPPIRFDNVATHMSPLPQQHEPLQTQPQPETAKPLPVSAQPLPMPAQAKSVSAKPMSPKEPPAKSGTSILDRVVESIQPQLKQENIQAQHFASPFKAMREEMLNDTEIDLDDTIPSMPTEMLIEELDNEEKRLSQDIMAFIDNMGDRFNEMPCTECGHQLSKENFIQHYKTHVESIQEAKEKLLSGNEDANIMQNWNGGNMESTPNMKTKSPAVENYSNSIFPTPPQIEEHGNGEPSEEDKIEKLQEEQKRISKDIVAFMSLFQQGVQQLQCSECQEVLTQVTIVEHFKKHILELNSQTELLVNQKRELKRKADLEQKDNLRKKLKTPIKQGSSSTSRNDVQESDNFSKFLDSVCPRMGIAGPTSKGTPMSKEEERKKIYKRLYGRKKYQYRISNCNDDVKVSEDEIDAELARSKSKYTGQPSAALSAMLGAENTGKLTPGQVLQTLVQTGSKEYKHEFKKARDRLYKRKLRIVRLNGGTGDMEIPRADIEIEMLTRYTSNKVKVEAMDVKKDPEVPCTNNWWEMTSAGLEPEMDINIGALEANLDLGFGPGGEQWLSANDPMMGEMVEVEYPVISGVEYGADLPAEMLTDHYYGANTTLEEGVDDMMAF